MDWTEFFRLEQCFSNIFQERSIFVLISFLANESIRRCFRIFVLLNVGNIRNKIFYRTNFNDNEMSW